MTVKETRLNNYLSNLPDFVFNFITMAYDGESINTQIAYCIDIKCFLTFLMKQPEFKNIKCIDNFEVSDLEKVTLMHLTTFKAYLEEYEVCYKTISGDEKKITLTNDQKGISRKLSSLRSLFSYLFKAELISKNITEKLNLPKIKHKIKKSLSFKDTINLINALYHGEQYIKEPKTLRNYQKRKQRDIAIFVTLLGTGLRVSELTELNVSDIDFDNSSFVIIRKGGDNQEIYMPLQVENEIYLYLEERNSIRNIKDKDALFLSNRGTRITISTIEKLLKGYCGMVGIEHKDKTTVHALRRTFACQLIEDGIDIKLVSELMGHKDISTTAKFYAHHNKKAHRDVMFKRILPNVELKNIDTMAKMDK